MKRISEVAGGGYTDFWHFRGRYRVVKGSRASKKSKTAALWFIVHLMKYPQSNLLVVRKTYRTLKDSCFTELKWAIGRLGVEGYWSVRESPLEMTYLPTGQKIYFRGLDDPLKVTSIAAEKGCLCWMWIEEAYEISRQSDFDMLDESIRGEAPEELFKQITITFNPWNERHWLKKRFFDEQDENILAKTTTYRCNEFLDDGDRRMFDDMQRNNPRRYQVAGLGNWGITEGLIFENWQEEAFDTAQVSRGESIKPAFGLDFGYTNDPSALFCGLVNLQERIIYVFDELYEKAMTNRMLYERIAGMGYAKEQIIADSAEPKSIAELRARGLHRIRSARKGRDSINNGIQFIQGFRIIVHPRCVNFLTEISSYTWEADGAGKRMNRPCDAYNHLLDAMRYAMEGFLKGDTFSFW